MFGKTKYVVVLMGSSEASALGPFDSKGEAIERGIEIIVGLGIDEFSTREDIAEGLRHNGRNDVLVAQLAPTFTKVGLGTA